MKKILTILWLFVMVTVPFLVGQTVPIKRASDPLLIDLVLYGGISAQPENLMSNGYYDGLFVDYILLKSGNQKWTYGPYAMMNQSRFTENLERYTGRSSSVTLGNTMGYYDPNFFQSYESFVGLNVGIMYGVNKGESSSNLGNYRSRQEDVYICGSLNFNLLKKQDGCNLFSRSQIQLSFQKPLLTKREAYWNNKQLGGEPWNMTHYEAMVKQSIIDWYVCGPYISSKIISNLSYAAGNKKSEYGVGAEMSIHQKGAEDFVSVYYLYKWSNRDKNVFCFGLSVNVSAIY